MAGAVSAAIDGLPAHPTGAHSRSGSSSPLLALAPGPTRIVKSSSGLTWRGILIEKHLSSPGERRSTSINHHVLSMTTGSSSRFEYRRPSGEFLVCVNRPGSIMVTPIGPVPDMRFHERSEFIHCALEDTLTHDVLHDLEPAIPQPVFRSGIQDKGIQCILELLIEELDAPFPLGRLYVDSLAQALATRYVLMEYALARRRTSEAAGLAPRVLTRVLGKIEAHLDADLSLQALADESGYSRAHFLRLFRLATGVTPHQYILSLRLKRAQDQLKQSDASISDVALSCGFSSQSHMTSLFRRRLEMTPGEFRRHGEHSTGND
ncbi:MAG: helix-turn-helix domain-containing protein [Acidobacteria bacterium]|nr:helix-turn-helix domain-containing protein [Acidobacteriota bacterium]